MLGCLSFFIMDISERSISCAVASRSAFKSTTLMATMPPTSQSYLTLLVVHTTENYAAVAFSYAVVESVGVFSDCLAQFFPLELHVL